MCERVLQTQAKWQRAENLSEEQRQPKPMSHSYEQHNYRAFFCRLTPELTGPALGPFRSRYYSDVTKAANLMRVPVERLVMRRRPTKVNDLAQWPGLARQPAAENDSQ